MLCTILSQCSWHTHNTLQTAQERMCQGDSGLINLWKMVPMTRALCHHLLDLAQKKCYLKYSGMNRQLAAILLYNLQMVLKVSAHIYCFDDVCHPSQCICCSPQSCILETDHLKSAEMKSYVHEKRSYHVCMSNESGIIIGGSSCG